MKWIGLKIERILNVLKYCDLKKFKKTTFFGNPKNTMLITFLEKPMNTILFTFLVYILLLFKIEEITLYRPHYEIAYLHTHLKYTLFYTCTINYENAHFAPLNYTTSTLTP